MDVTKLKESMLTEEGHDLLQRSILRMLFSHSDAVFHAYFLVKMAIIREKHPPHSMGMGVALEKGQFTLSYDEERCMASGIDDLDTHEWTLTHEDWHYILSHPWRERMFFDNDEERMMMWHIVWNMCADVEIHNHHKPCAKLVGKVCQVGVGPFKDFPPDLTAEDYMIMAMKKANNQPPKDKNKQKGQGEGKGGEGEPDPNAKPEPGQGEPQQGDGKGTEPGRWKIERDGNKVTITDTKTGEKSEFQVNDNGVPKQGPQEDLDKELLRAQLSEALKEARPHMGTEPGGLLSIVEKLLMPPRIDWRHRLRQLVGKYCRFSWHGTWKRWSRRMGEGFRGRIKDHGLTLLVAVDTSASVKDYELAEFANEIENIRKCHKVKRVIVIECDASIHEGGIYDLKPGTPFPCKFLGRGGTDFRPVFEYVDAVKPKFDMMIWLTDSQGQWPERKPLYPIIWAVTKKEALAAIPWGDIVFMEVDKPRGNPNADMQKANGKE
jgi:predicted metal-dependent peptidase